MLAKIPPIGWGMVAVLVYLAAVAASQSLPVRLLYDGLAPLPPYRWVHPPADRAGDNRRPEPRIGTVPFDPQGSRAAEVDTDDDQALVTFPAGALAGRAGETSVRIVITPLDPATVAPVPAGRRFEGNAYRIEVTYSASATPAKLARPVMVVLRYAVHGTAVLQSDGGGWKPVPVTRFDGSQQLLVTADSLGTFVPAGP
jgi:hypothetical protein